MKTNETSDDMELKILSTLEDIAESLRIISGRSKVTTFDPNRRKTYAERYFSPGPMDE